SRRSRLSDVATESAPCPSPAFPRDDPAPLLLAADYRLIVEQHVPVIEFPIRSTPRSLPPMVGHLRREGAHCSVLDGRTTRWVVAAVGYPAPQSGGKPASPLRGRSA